MIFTLFGVSLAVILGLREFRAFAVGESRFDYGEVEESFMQKREEVALLAQRRMERFAPKIEEVAAEPAQPLVVLDTPELVRGSEAYARCIVCHGRAGGGKKSQNAPAIGGQYDWYIEKQIMDMQAGRRENQTMMPYIRKLSVQDIKDLAAYISRLPWPGGG